MGPFAGRAQIALGAIHQCDPMPAAQRFALDGGDRTLQRVSRLCLGDDRDVVNGGPVEMGIRG